MRRRRSGGEKRKPTWLPPKAPTPHFFFFISEGANRDGSDGRSGLIGELNPSLPFLFIFFLPPPIHFVKAVVWGWERRVVKLSRGISQVVLGGEIGSADGEGVDQGVGFPLSKTKTKSFLQRNVFGGNVSPPAGTSEGHFLSGRSLHEGLRWRRRRRGKEVSNPTNPFAVFVGGRDFRKI